MNTVIKSLETPKGKYVVTHTGFADTGEPLYRVDAQLTAFSFPLALTDLTLDEANATVEEYGELVQNLPWELLDD